jgi:hypothetical protein
MADIQPEWDRLSRDRPDMPKLDPSKRPSWSLIRWLAPSWLAAAVPGVLGLAYGIAGIVGAAPLFAVFALLPGAFFAYLAFSVAYSFFTGRRPPGARAFRRMARVLLRDVRHPGTE